MDFRQRTLRKEVACTGIGLHSGHKVHLKIRPAPSGTGIKFLRRDLTGQPMIPAAIDHVLDTTLATSIGRNGTRISTVEHLMAAFFGLGIDNAVVEVDGPEVPIMDGSAAPFVFLLKSAGIREQQEPKRFLIVKKPFHMKDGDRSVSIFPAKEIRISYTIDFQHPLIRNQHHELVFSGGDFVREISRARTFGFLKDVEKLKETGFALGGSLDNAVVVDEFRILNEDGLRYSDEFVRHKILDFIGDLAVIGAPIIGRFEVRKSGHFLNQLMLRELMQAGRYWKAVTFNTREECRETPVRIPVFAVSDPAPA